VSDDPGLQGGRTFRLVLEYDGRDFEGWQIQASGRNARTVQGALTEALESVTQEPARVRGAGRTDSGVHAMAQVASARVATTLSPEQLARALNGRLPRDIAVRELVEVPQDWDALRAAKGKVYRYQLWNGETRSPLRARRFHWLRDPLDLPRMREAAEAFVGTHDFAALQGAGSDVKTTVRTVHSLQIEGETGGEILIDVEGGGFLRHMVRNLVGTLIEIGRGRWPVSRAAEVLASLDRQEAGPTAPAEGLVLVEVRDGWRSPEDTRTWHCGGSPVELERALPVDEDGPVG